MVRSGDGLKGAWESGATGGGASGRGGEQASGEGASCNWANGSDGRDDDGGEAAVGGVGGGKHSTRRTGDLGGCLSGIFDGMDVPLDTSVDVDHRPDWLDDEKLERGRKFAVMNLLGVVYAEMLSLAFLLSLRGSLEALVFSGNSHTPILAFKRYLSTLTRVISWYEGDHRQEGSEAKKNLKTVRAMHADVARKMNSCSPDRLSRLVSLEARSVATPSSTQRELQTDFGDAIPVDAEECPFVAKASLSRDRCCRSVHVNQLELSLTQFGFMGLLLLFPDKFGATGASEGDLEAFVHLWRSLGHSLGIRERYNFCSGSLKETRERCRAVLERLMKPCVREATLEWEHMYRCVVSGSSYYVPLNTFGGSLAYLCWVVGVKAPRLLASLSWWEWAMYLLQRLSFGYLCRLPGFVPFLNLLLRTALWRADKSSRAWIEDHERRAFKMAASSECRT